MVLYRHMSGLGIEKYQQILDSFSVGKITFCHQLDDVNVSDDNTDLTLMRVVLETTQGIYLLVFGSEESIHPLWWSSPNQEFIHKIQKLANIENAEALDHGLNQDNQPIDTTHKFDMRFVLFRI